MREGRKRTRERDITDVQLQNISTYSGETWSIRGDNFTGFKFKAVHVFKYIINLLCLHIVLTI